MKTYIRELFDDEDIRFIIKCLGRRLGSTDNGRGILRVFDQGIEINGEWFDMSHRYMDRLAKRLA